MGDAENGRKRRERRRIPWERWKTAENAGRGGTYLWRGRKWQKPQGGAAHTFGVPENHGNRREGRRIPWERRKTAENAGRGSAYLGWDGADLEHPCSRLSGMRLDPDKTYP